MSNPSTSSPQAVRPVPVPVPEPLERLRERFAGVQIWIGGWSREFLAIVRGRMVVARSAASLELLLSELHTPALSRDAAQPGSPRHVGGGVLEGGR